MGTKKGKLNQDDLFLFSLGICASDFNSYIWPMIEKILKNQDLQVLRRLFAEKDYLNVCINCLLEARIFSHFEFLQTDKGIQPFLNINGQRYWVRHPEEKSAVVSLFGHNQFGSKKTHQFYRKLKAIQDFKPVAGKPELFDYFDKASWYINHNNHDYDYSWTSWAEKYVLVKDVEILATENLKSKGVDLSQYIGEGDFLEEIINDPDIFEVDYRLVEEIPVITEELPSISQGHQKVYLPISKDN